LVAQCLTQKMGCHKDLLQESNCHPQDHLTDLLQDTNQIQKK